MRIPADDADGLEWLLFEQSGVLTTAQALRFLTRAKMRHQISAGRWRPIGHGVLPMAMPLVKVHRTTVWTKADLQIGRPPRTSMARSVLEAASWAYDDEEAVSIVAAACQQRRVEPSDLLAAVERFPTLRRRGLIVETARFATQGATSPPEIDFLKLCRKNRLPEPQTQVARQDAAGRRRYLDFYWAAFGVNVEVDGAQHVDFREWAADMKRQNDLWVSGDRVLRFPAFLIRTKPEEVAAQVIAALRAGGWCGES